MNTDRRTFLRSLAASAASAAAKPILNPGGADVYENAILRVRARKPEGWKYLGRIEWALLWSDTRFREDLFSDDELKQILGQPLVTMVPIEKDRTNVEPHMSICPDPMADSQWSLAEGHENCRLACEELMHDFLVLEGPHPSEIGGVAASRMVARYTHTSVSEASVSCEVEHFLVKRDGLFVGVNFGRATAPHAPGVLAQLEGIRDSLEFWD